MKNLLQKLTGKMKFAENLFRLGLAFAFVASCGVFVSAQTPFPRPNIRNPFPITSPAPKPFISPIQIQQDKYKQFQRQMQVQMFVNKITGYYIDWLIRKNKLQQTPRINLAPTITPLPKFEQNKSFNAKPKVVVTSKLPVTVQSVNLPNTKPSSMPAVFRAHSGIQTISSLNIVGDLGNGTVIVKDAGGKLYSLRLTQPGSVRQNVRAGKQRSRRTRN